MAGPLEGPEGVRFAYCTSAANCSSTVTSEGEIALVSVTLRVKTGADADAPLTLTTDVALRNRR